MKLEVWKPIENYPNYEISSWGNVKSKERYVKVGIKMKYELPSIELIVIEENNYLKFGEYLNDMQCDDTANKLSLDDLEYVKKLQQENKQLKDNWNKLKEYCKENTLCYEVGDDENTKLIGSRIHGLNVLDKMQELEQGSDSNE